MAFDLNTLQCQRCIPFPCAGFEGLISLDFSARGSSSWLSGDCSSPDSVPGGTVGDTYIKGPTVGNISLSAYAYKAGEKDIWLGTRCFGQVQGNQSIIQKYDGDSDKYYLIQSRDNSAVIAGGIGNDIASIEASCSTPITSFRSQLSNNATITTSYDTIIGYNLHYFKGPISFSFPLMGMVFVFEGRACYLTSFNLNVDFPNPAVVDYSFQFIESCP